MRFVRYFVLFCALYFMFFYLGSGAGYDPITHAVKCHTSYECYHEIGHRVDQESGWISKRNAFELAVYEYLVSLDYSDTAQWSDFSKRLFLFPGFTTPKLKNKGVRIVGDIYVGDWGGTIELYADMLAWCNGNREEMPVEFVEFYDWELVEKYKERYLE